MLSTPVLSNIGSLIVYEDGGGDRCLGYLMEFKGHGVYDASFGRVDVTPESSAIHNKLLDQAMLKGLDENCEIGQHGTFYVGKIDGRLVVSTWLGTLVSDRCTQNGRSLAFVRGGKSFRGRLPEGADAFHFRRVA